VAGLTVPNLVLVKVGSRRAVDVYNAFESADIIKKERRPAGESGTFRDLAWDIPFGDPRPTLRGDALRDLHWG
jgi:hypothetical protein